MSWFSELFAVDDTGEDVRGKQVSQASEVLDAVDKPYFARLMKYLDEEADKPVALGEKMMESAVRANTFKEVRSKIRRDVRSAQDVLQEVKYAR